MECWIKHWLKNVRVSWDLNPRPTVWLSSAPPLTLQLTIVEVLLPIFVSLRSMVYLPKFIQVLLCITPKYYKQTSRFLACMYTIIIIIIIIISLRDRNTYSDICKNICISRHVSLDLHEIRLNFSCIINEPYYLSLSLSLTSYLSIHLSLTHTLSSSHPPSLSRFIYLSLSRSTYMFFSFSSTEVFFLYLSIEYNHNS